MLKEPVLRELVTACPRCMINLIDNVLHNKMPQKVYYLLELVE